MEKVSLSASSGLLVPYWGSWCTDDPQIYYVEMLCHKEEFNTGWKQLWHWCERKRRVITGTEAPPDTTGTGEPPRTLQAALLQGAKPQWLPRPEPPRALSRQTQTETPFLWSWQTQLSQICAGYVGLEEFRLKLLSAGTSSWPSPSILRARGAVLRFTCKWELAILAHLRGIWTVWEIRHTSTTPMVFSCGFWDLSTWHQQVFQLACILFVHLMAGCILFQKTPPKVQISSSWFPDCSGLGWSKGSLGSLRLISAHLCSGAW